MANKKTLIGSGNQILKNIVDIVDNDIEINSPKEICLKERLGDLAEKIIYKLVEERVMFDKASDYIIGTLKEFKKEKNEIEREIDQYGDLWDDEKILTKSLEEEEFNDKIKNIEDERKATSKTVKDLRGIRAQVISEIKVFKKNRKELADSIYTFVDKVLIKHAIIIAAYHSGDLNGGVIIILMDKAHDNMSEIKAHLIQCTKDNTRC